MVHLSDSSVEKSSTLQMNQEKEPFLVIYNGETYDLRKFVDVHPGGTEILQEYRNQDITDLMSNKDIHVHSPMAFDYLKSMKVRKQYDIRSEPSSELTKSGSFGDRSSPSHVFDVERPLLWQLWTNERITKEDYLQMTHTPILSQKSHRLFENNYLEFLSKTPWWIIPLVWLPVISLMLKSSIDKGLPLFMATFVFIIGLLSWTLTEYVFHRFIFHSDAYLPRHRYIYTLHFLIHGIHHYMPIDPYRLVMPPALFILLSIVVIYPLTLVIKDAAVRLAFVAGLFLGYVGYDLTHYYLHHATVITQYMKSLKTYHMEHHFKDPNAGFGVTSKFWDRIFGSEPTRN